MKHTKKAISGLMVLGVLGISPVVLAESSVSTTSDFGTVNTSSNRETTMSQGDYWAQRKLEEQRKSTEMRKSKYTEMKTKGYDMSSVSSDVLDASKTDESAFWNAMKVVMAAKDAGNRQNIANELKKSGLDTSLLTPDILDPNITDEGAFWKLVKAIKDKRENDIRTSKPGYVERTNTTQNMDTGKKNEETNR